MEVVIVLTFWVTVALIAKFQDVLKIPTHWKSAVTMEAVIRQHISVTVRLGGQMLPVMYHGVPVKATALTEVSVILTTLRQDVKSVMRTGWVLIVILPV